jgi:glycosyltransferase involved in cell wall biosynthesis
VKRFAAVIPAWNVGGSLLPLLSALPPEAEVIVVDDGSTPPVAVPARTLRHPQNRGYGAAQRSGYQEALALGHDRILLLHGDGQYNLEDSLRLVDALDREEVVIGSRFLSDPSVIPGWRRLGNRGLTTLANWRFGVTHTELHSGARAFRASALLRLDLSAFSDDYLFDQQLLCALFRAGVHVAELPMRTRYDETTQSIPFGRSVRYGLGCVREILRSGPGGRQGGAPPPPVR